MPTTKTTMDKLTDAALKSLRVIDLPKITVILYGPLSQNDCDPVFVRAAPPD